MIASALAIAVLLLISAFFSGSETGLTAASRARMHYLAQEGSRRAKLVNALLERKERLIGAILLGNNALNIAASAIATGMLIDMFGEAGVIYATLAMTALVLIFGEVAPKTYAINNPDRVALAVAPLLRGVVALLSPVTNVVQVVISTTLKLFGAKITRSRGLVSAAEELRSSIDLHVREGGMVKHERDMLGSILDLDEVPVSDIMIHRGNMQMVDAGQPPRATVDEVLASNHTRLPLWRDDPDNIIGVLHARDLFRAMSRPGFDIEKLDLTALVSKPWFIPETTSLREQLAAFRQRHAHLALVVDEYGSLMGVVTLEDILEEIVGDISDEHDRKVSGVRSHADGSYSVDGTVTIRDLNRQFEWSLPDEEAATIAGLVINEARLLPEIGQVFAFHGFKFEVVRRHRNQITLLRVTPLPAEATLPAV